MTKHERIIERAQRLHGQPVHTITLRRESGAWWADSSDPAVLELFGTPSLVTAFSDITPAWRVKQHVELCNPDSVVTVKG